MLLENRTTNYFDRLFNELMHENKTNYSLMKTNIVETDDAYILDMLVPGIDKENIDISLEDKYLTIKTNAKTDKTKYLLKEFEIPTYSRSYYVGNIDIKNISAKFNNGILTLTISKQKDKEIQIKKISIE